MKHTRLFIALAPIALGLALALPAAAAGIAVKPAQIEQKVELNSTKTFTMTVTNGEDTEQVFYPVVRNVTGVQGGSQPIFDESGHEPTDMEAWLQFDKSSVTVGPHQSASVDVTAHIPADASPGSHIAGFFFSDKPAPAVGILGASVGMDVGAIINFQVPGDTLQRAEIRSFSVGHGIYTKPPVDFAVAIESDGNTLVRPVGFVDITDMFGKKVASLPVNENGAGVFPKTTREWPVQWAPSGLVFGRFTALLAVSVDTDQGQDTLARQVNFWVLPTNIIVPVLIGFAVFLLISYVLLRIYVRGQVNAATRSKGKERAAEGLSVFTSVLIGILLAIIIGFLIVFFYFG